MKIAIVHYHLRSGGVTRVIELACRALSQSGLQIAVLAGDIPAKSKIPNIVPTACLPKLDYEGASYREGKDLQRDLEKAACHLLGGTPDIWHIHNHSLGKNLALPAVVAAWAESGAAMLLQIHDFAENQRPKNYLHLVNAYGENLNCCLYPCTPRIGYALLNCRDERILKTIGFPGKIFYIPNPVLPLATSRDPILLPLPEIESLVVYPCRAIRRKNIGEALLLTCGFHKGKHLAIALPPHSSEDLALYEHWKVLAANCRLPIQFEVCSQQDILLGDLIARADCVVTTSMEEGFGMTFLEAWVANKPLIGRDLPAITRDFRVQGLILDSFYDFLGIPISCIGKATVENSLLNRWEKIFAPLGITLDRRSRDKLFDRAVRGDRVDFGQLEPDLQTSLIRRASQSLFAAEEIIPKLPPIPGPKSVEINKQVVETKYSLAEYRLQLLQTYQDLLLERSYPITYGDSWAIFRAYILAFSGSISV
jgi:glycosyltransferase involved in cell wall biosynthesis